MRQGLCGDRVALISGRSENNDGAATAGAYIEEVCNGSERKLRPMIILSILFLAQSELPPVVASGEQIKSPKQPQIAVDAKGRVHVAFGDGNRIFYLHSESVAPLRFAVPVLVAETPNLALGMRRGPRVAVSGRAIVVTAISGAKGRGRDENLLAWRSTDDGKTWDGPVTVNDTAGAAREGLHATVSMPEGGFVCAWIDLRTKLADVRVSTSADGVKWTPNVVAYQSPSGRVCECCQPSLAVADNRNIHLLWRNSLDGLRDMYMAASSDGGATFGPATKLGHGSWTLNACPMDGGGIAVRNGKASSAWRRERIVYGTFDGDPKEVRLGEGEQPCIAATNAGAVVAWLKRRPGPLMLKAGNKEAAVIADDASDPVLVSTPDFKRAVVAWEGKRNGRPTIEARTVEGDLP